VLTSSFFRYNPLVYFWRYNYTGYAIWICEGKHEIPEPQFTDRRTFEGRSRRENIYRDVSSGAKAERHDLDLMISRLREGDTIIVWKLDRIARSISHLLKLVEQFEKIGVKFRSINDPFVDTTSAHGKFVITLFGAVAQLERDIIIERTTAGLKSARRRYTAWPEKRSGQGGRAKGHLGSFLL